MAPETRYTTNGDVRIAYETFGDPATGEPLLLATGLDFQMVWWHDGFCEALVERGFAVVRFDNRDTGLSTHFASPAEENPWRARLGRTKPVYTGMDMLDDMLAVLDAVGWRSATVVGGAMGAALAQALALVHPDRVRAIVSMAGLPVDSSPLRTLTYLKYGVFLKLIGIARARTRDEHVDALVEMWRAMSSPRYPFPEEWARRTAAVSHDRAPRDPASTQRQLAAGRAQKYGRLEDIAVPTLVISGEDDPMIRVRGGRDTARRIPGARFVSYTGLGHTLPEELWPDIVDRIADLAGLPAPASAG